MRERTTSHRRRRLVRLLGTGLLGLVVGSGIYLGAGILSAPRPHEAPGWSLAAEMPEPRGETATATTADGRLFVIGGLTGAGFETSGSVSIFDPGDGRWTVGPPLADPRHHAAAAALGDDVYVSGGASSIAGGAPRDEVWVLRTGSSAWERIADMPGGRFGHRMIAHEGRLYVVGGIGGPADGTLAPEGAMLAYDTVANAWTAGAAIPLARDHLSAVLVDGEIWAIGGRSNGQSHARVDIYDPVTDAWRAGPALPEPTSGAAEAAIGPRILISGGEDPGTGAMVEHHWILDAGAGTAATWLPLTAPPLTVHGAPGAVVDGRFAIAGGASRAGGQSNTAWSGLLQVLLELP